MDPAATDDTDARRRGGRAAAAIAACALLVLLVAGCSAGAGDAAPQFGGSADGPAAEGDDGGEGGGEDSDADRAVIVEGWMSMTVDDVLAASGSAQQVVDRAGGRVEGREESSGGDDTWSTLELRVPSDALDRVVAELRALGEVDHITTTSSDVTDAVRDIDARVDALEATLVRLQSFQAKTATVDDLLEIEREVSERQADLERLRAEQASYADRIQFSALRLELRSEGAPSAAAPGTFGDGFLAGWGALVAFVGTVLVVFGALVPWIVVFGALTLLVLWIVRSLRRRRRVTAPAAPAPPVPPSA